MSINQFPQHDGPVDGSVEKKAPFKPGQAALVLLIVIGGLTALAIAPALVIAAWNVLL